ncbi:hypothetical protein FEM48_Zijuj05G0155800 [Ziziphus jujuba var. spinosa]|uniref:Uncharacterized protein n=1 Tax=Ziziphus jujuba var. spinosa TaxID=714518 RepID=A0A978VFM9_ZIZJJ|nr:hypothetical protein FEM48_Zijuj05G0155800 [Ziziphus jujuba var. spinosa]
MPAKPRDHTYEFILSSTDHHLFFKAYLIGGPIRITTLTSAPQSVFMSLLRKKLDIFIDVTSLSSKATEKDVYDFFTYCGAIEHVEIIREALGVERVVVAMVGLSIILLLGVLDWDDCLSGILAWDTLAWFVVLEWAWPGN